MPEAKTAYSVKDHLAGRAASVTEIYHAVLAAARKNGPVKEDPKKTSIHLVASTAFAGVATRQESLILTLKSAEDIRSSRITKHEQASAHRWHLEIRLEKASQVDRELTGWLKAAYKMSVPP